MTGPSESEVKMFDILTAAICRAIIEHQPVPNGKIYFAPTMTALLTVAALLIDAAPGSKHLEHRAELVARFTWKLHETLGEMLADPDFARRIITSTTGLPNITLTDEGIDYGRTDQ